MLLSRGRKTGLALLDGDAPPDELLRDWLAEATLFVCADGAGNHEAPRPPDAIVGDMDSLKAASPKAPIVRAEDPGFTDSEKCVRYLVGEGCDRIVLLGGTGGRQDHHLVNLALPLTRPGEILLAGGDFEAIGLEGSHRFVLPTGRGLSIFPLQGPITGLSLRGVEFPLEQADLDHTRGLTASNRVLDSHVEVDVPKGRLLLILERRAGDALWRTEL